MTILEYLQDMELEDRVALVGCADNALRGLRNCTAKTAATSFLQPYLLYRYDQLED